MMALLIEFIELFTASILLLGASPFFKTSCGSPFKVKITTKDWGKRQ
ncbi:hypothetical protein O2N63_08260 [Aliiroseovarius sp. KMU-50]|uniref:Uncharacterized protein n=1 Tax=Aliiroseovarius salicola TaxID=3009082 RepID=A0ABT4W0P6_9RHOB|nr:hypothetical protein [Aliiroseovarius sp. KMU-50]MDA5094081.1 hypothetical protein [Aliiroseovarius sp. KMU-50]